MNDMALFGRSTTVRLDIEGMTCDNCVRHVTEALKNAPGVKKADVRLDESRAEVTTKGDPDMEGLVAAVEAAGYKAKAA